MAVADRVREVLNPTPSTEVPKEIEERTARGRSRMRDGASKRNEAMKFWRGDQYVYRSDDGMLISQNTITLANGQGKPRHRVRTTRNMIFDIVAHVVSSLVSRTPGYEINPSTSEPEDYAAAVTAGKVARYGYDKWRIRDVTEAVVTYATVAEAGFAWPYWDSSVGPYMQATDPVTGQERTVGQGEVGIRVFGPNEVYWEPGLSFDESRWHVVEQARPIADIQATEGFNTQIKLTADASADDDGVSREKITQHTKLALEKQYLERPSIKHPRGRWLTIVNGKVICPERDYPCQDHLGNVVDEPVLHHLCYVPDPDSDRDQGLVPHLLDAQRTINDCINKSLEWKNLMMNPQIIIRNGEFKQQITDEPGAVYHAVGSGEITIREIGEVPQSLGKIKEDAIADMARIAAQNDIPGQVESGRGIQALIEKDQTRSASLIARLAEFHSRLMRHCLYLVQRHYTEARQITVEGRRGPSNLRAFKGAELRGQADVTVLPGSIEPRTRAQVTQLVLAYADRGWIDPDSAMSAIDHGSAEALMERIEKDEGRANEIIQSIEDGTFMEQPPRPVFLDEDPGPAEDANGNPIPMVDPTTGQQLVDPMTGAPQWVPATTVPGWMPRPFDRIPVHKAITEDWMKSQVWSMLSDDQKQAGMAYYSALLQIEANQAAKAQAQQMQQAMELGAENAARPADKAMPDQPGGSGQNGQQPSEAGIGAPPRF